MFVRRLTVDRLTPTGEATPCPIKCLDSFCMRNFTNDAVFDDTLPIADGLLEAGLRVPLALLQERMADWFGRKGYLQPGDSLLVQEIEKPTARGAGLWSSNKWQSDSTSAPATRVPATAMARASLPPFSKTVR